MNQKPETYLSTRLTYRSRVRLKEKSKEVLLFLPFTPRTDPRTTVNWKFGGSPQSPAGFPQLYIFTFFGNIGMKFEPQIYLTAPLRHFSPVIFFNLKSRDELTVRELFSQHQFPV